MKILKVGCPAYWGSLVPALQHTAYADALLSNQFESLVKESQGGAITPGLALKWEVNQTFTNFRFYLDTSRKFSNGENLSAAIVKEAWEHGLSLPSRSANSSLQDVLYLVSGFKDFNSNNRKISGVKAIGDSVLEIEFVKPFRTALPEFATGRLSIFIVRDGNYLGTGPYIISNKGESELILKQNPNFGKDIGFSEVHVKVVDPATIDQAFATDEIDLYAFADRANLESCDSANISCFAGMESAHSVVIPNGMKGRFFENGEHRKALQYLIHKNLKVESLPSNYKRNLDLDPQVFLRLQSGRVSEVEVDQLVDHGSQYVSSFVEATQKRPLYLVTSEMNNWVKDILEPLGVRFDSRSGIISTKDRMQMYYKTFEPDLFVLGTSISSGDPDGIFHVLGKDGAIHSPVLFRNEVSDLLEKGREILDVSKLDGHYQKVTRSVLSTVPYVHIGFIRGLFAFNPTRVKVTDGIKQREGNQFTLFSPR